jgi:hypothetical protein
MATYYVRPTNGNDANDGLSFAAAWQTTQKAASVAVLGDTVYLCAEAPEPIGATVTLPDAVNWIGCNASGVADGTTYAYQIAASVTGFIPARNQITNVAYSGNSADSIAAGEGANATWSGCSFDGFEHVFSFATANSAVNARCFDCEFANVSSYVCNNGSNRVSGMFQGCLFRASVNRIYAAGPATVWLVSCIVLCPINGVVTNYGNPVLIGNVFWASPVVIGDRSTSNIIPLIINNVFANSASYGISWRDANPSRPMALKHNLFYNNTSGDLGTPPAGVYLDDTNIVGQDPLFVSTVPGSEDFTPLPGSPLIGAGLNGTTIGALVDEGRFPFSGRGIQHGVGR